MILLTAESSVLLYLYRLYIPNSNSALVCVSTLFNANLHPHGISNGCRRILHARKGTHRKHHSLFVRFKRWEKNEVKDRSLGGLICNISERISPYIPRAFECASTESDYENRTSQPAGVRPQPLAEVDATREAARRHRRVAWPRRLLPILYVNACGNKCVCICMYVCLCL